MIGSASVRVTGLRSWRSCKVGPFGYQDVLDHTFWTVLDQTNPLGQAADALARLARPQGISDTSQAKCGYIYILSIYLSIYLSIHPSIHLSIHPSIHPSLSLKSIHPFIHSLIISLSHSFNMLSIHSFIHSFIYTFTLWFIDSVIH